MFTDVLCSRYNGDGEPGRIKVMELKRSRTSSILELNYQDNLMVHSATTQPHTTPPALGHDMEKRSSECFEVKRGLTTRLRNSAIPHMQRLLNEKEKRKREICRQIDDYQPVNNGLICKSVSLRD